MRLWRTWQKKMTERRDQFQMYLREIKRLSSLHPDEERRLMALGAAGDENAKREVIQSHLQEVADLALASRPSHLREDDAVQEANILLVRVVERALAQGSPLDRDGLREAIRTHLTQLEPPGEPP